MSILAGRGIRGGDNGCGMRFGLRTAGSGRVFRDRTHESRQFLTCDWLAVNSALGGAARDATTVRYILNPA